MKYVKIRGSLGGVPTKELAQLYRREKKNRLKMVYEIKYIYLDEIAAIKKELERRLEEIKSMEASARYDRENADGMAYNEVLLSIN